MLSLSVTTPWVVSFGSSTRSYCKGSLLRDDVLSTIMFRTCALILYVGHSLPSANGMGISKDIPRKDQENGK